MVRLIFAAIGIALGYLFGAFSAASFDISTWDVYWRFVTALLMTLGGITGAVLKSKILEIDLPDWD